MAMTDAQFAAWLKKSASISCVLVEVNVMVGGVETTRYLSTKGYVSGPADTPANTHYAPGIVGGVKFTETLPLDGTATLAFGDIEIENIAGNRDSWFDDVWNNRAIKVFIGDVSWIRSDFRQIFEGIVAGIDAKDRGRINLKISDKLQRLNTPITENKLGGTTANADRLLPLCFGECHNITPLLTDSTVNEYQVHDGPIENIIEVRDNGVPVAFTPFLTTGKFRLTVQPSGQITASVQGAKPAEVLSAEMNSEFTCDSFSTWTESVVGIASIVAGKIRVTSSGAQVRLTKRFPTVPGLKYRVSMSVTATGGFAQAIMSLVGATNVVAANGPQITTVASGNSATPSIDFTATGFESTVVLYVTGAGVYGDYDNISFKQVQDGSYMNTAPTLIRYIATRYGSATNKLSYDELDSDLFAFEQSFVQPVGLYVTERTNTIQAITDLANSIGAKPVFNRGGKFTLVRIKAASEAPTASLFWPMDGPNTYLFTGWSALTGTYTYSGGKGIVASNAGVTNGVTVSVSFPGASYSRIKMKIKRTSGSGWSGLCTYSTDGHTAITTFSNTLSPNPLAVGEEKILVWDMENLTAGGTDWVTSTVRTVRISLGLDGANDAFEIDWISIEPGVSNVTPTDIVQGSLAMSSLPAVKAGVKIGYCKNWTVETNIAAGVDIRHADLYGQEWLTITQTDTATQTNYKTFADPEQQDTMLLTNADAMAEAVRRLSLYNKQRKVLKYEGMPWLMLDLLGATQILTNSRFNLSGTEAQIISTSVDWLNPHITVEILV